MIDLAATLTDRLSPAFASVAGKTVDPIVRGSRQAHFQADGALALARELGRNPRDIAAEIVNAAQLDDLCESVEISGPGFINLTLSDSTLAEAAGEALEDPRLGVSLSGAPDVVVIDYSSPNAAKEMHVGHLRSTIIGDAAARLLEWLGHTVIRQNHLGDWGTPFGMLIEHMVDIGDVEATRELSMGDLNEFYRAARQKFDTDTAFKERSRERVVQLQAGDQATLRLWQLLIDQSIAYFMSIYKRLAVTQTEADFAGESSYNNELGDVVNELDSLGLIVESDGALCVFPEGFTSRDGEKLPLIVRKKDGGYNYASTDLATIRHSIRDLQATRMLYVVGLPQAQHFAMIFETAREAGWLTTQRAEHIAFGSVLGKDGRMLRTREGDNVKLADLLDEAVERAAVVVKEKNPDLDEETQREVAEAVGYGAIKYADLSVHRNRDYIFDYDRMLTFEGDTAPYLQYAHARARSILRKAEDARSSEESADALRTPAGLIVLTDDAERGLVLDLLAFGPTLSEVAESMEFQKLTNYLHALAAGFTLFYSTCPVLSADEPIRSSRLALCELTARTFATGLDVLGIATPDQM